MREPADVQPTLPRVALWLRRHLRRGARVIDIGANIGDYTVLAASVVGERGHVYSFEPAPRNAERLRQRCAGLANVSVFEQAVGGRRRNVRLYLDADHDTQHSLGSHNVGRAGGSLQVRQVALDELDMLDHIDLIKIDAQGAELGIVEGARQLLERCRPLMVLEFWPYGMRRLRTEPEALLEALTGLGYDVFRLSKSGRARDPERIHTLLTDPSPSRWHKLDIVALPR